MTKWAEAPVGAPCWADLWTSDVEGSRRFYSRLFGWEAQEPDPGYGGYFMFTRQGAPIAGGMGSMGDMQANDTWKPFFCTHDIGTALEKAESAGGSIVAGAMPIDRLGSQAVVVDPTGATFGLWQPGQFHGFSATGEDGAPSWFELHTADHPVAVTFYREVLGAEFSAVGDTDQFRYWTFRSPGTGEDVGGIMDSGSWVAAGAAAWSVYWEVDDIEATAALVAELGGTVRRPPETTPYGKLAVMADPAGAEFRLRTSPGGRHQAPTGQ